MTFDADGREYPYLDKAIGSQVVKHHGDYLVSVTPMGFNDRIVLTHRKGYPFVYERGWCYDKGGAAALAALAWDLDESDEPAGFKKRVGD